MKRCGLCDRAARMYCESDQACLCWECDAKVHGANFLVARHTRELLCRNCQEQTPWRAAGPRLNPTISVCESCAAVGKAVREGEVEEGLGGGAEMMEEDDDDDEYEEEDSELEEEEDEEEEEGENQVVPWTLTSPPPPSSSSGEESSSPGRARASLFLRLRENADPDSQNEMNCYYSRRNQIATAHPQPASLFRASAVSDTISIRHHKERQRSLHRHLPPPVTDGTSNQIAVNLVSSTSRSPQI
ncbi:hypothetical protein HPP92_014085 [Vanilla planifolia]|uniref:B box-type domain-containing protein n=1 Tax=Vanilla planifolia TaxID=51239 RepID=A0A835QR91_VANPL|nr:hypothetical protein HPP92_014085 [Vanilla planifolia]